MLTGLRVFFVEDEALVAMLVEEYLQDLGCEVVGKASRLDDALEKARSIDADIGLLDVNLAGRLSYPVAEALRDRNIPFVFATGYGTSSLPDGLLASPVLSKPYRLSQLAAILQTTRCREAVDQPPREIAG